MPSLSLKPYQEDRQDRGVYDKRNPLNDLTGKEWLFSTKTVIPKNYSQIWSGELKGIKFFDPLPIDLCKEIIETFSKPKETILDPFAGIGSTCFGSYLANEYINPPRRNYIGIEQNKLLFKEFNVLLKNLKIPANGMLCGDRNNIISEIKDGSIDFIFCDIPLWEITESVGNITMKEFLKKFQSSPIEYIDPWFTSTFEIIKKSLEKLKDSKYYVITLPNGLIDTLNKNDVLINFSLTSKFVVHLQQIGSTLKAERIWFIPNKKLDNETFQTLNRRLLVFRKEKDRVSNNGANLLVEEYFPLGSTNIIHKAYPPSFNHKLRSQHGGMKPPELAQLLIETFSKNQKDLILDPFAGVGGTLLGASLTSREAIGIDINEQWKSIYLQVSQEAKFIPQKFLVGDSREILDKEIPSESVDLILTDVPYWAMDKLKKTRGRFSRAGEDSKGKLPSPLKKFDHTPLQTIEEWLTLNQEVFGICYQKLKPQRFLIVFIGNMYRTMKEKASGKNIRVGRFLMLTSSLANVLLEIGYEFDQEIVWYSPDKALHVFGYPFSYIPSVVHQSILIFKKK